jgi:succinate dehydrogenase / fumarate reductase cytochrome b subunit
MAWLTQSLSSSLGKKVIVSLTGIFLILFLIVHMAGNMALLKHDGGAAFNQYSHFMTTNPLIKAISYVLYLSILIHSIYGVILAIKNRKSRGEHRYAEVNNQSSWASRNMALLGSLIFIFIVIHMKNFWFEYKFGTIDTVTIEGEEYKDLYSVTYAAFKQWWYVAFYIVALIALALHLAHGFQSSFRTLGMSHQKYVPFVKGLGLAYSILIPLLFAIQPLYILFFK